jgi:DNA-binding Xre family transcriptional regulator
MSKSDLAKTANVSGATLTKLSKGENVNVDILIKICTALDCTLDDIIDFIPDKN